VVRHTLMAFINKFASTVGASTGRRGARAAGVSATKN